MAHLLWITVSVSDRRPPHLLFFDCMLRLDDWFSRWVSHCHWEHLQMWLITLLALFQAVLFLIIVPPWQHYDEPAHFRFAWSQVHLEADEEDRFFTPLDPSMIRETLASMVEHEFYAKLPAPNFLRTYGIDTLGHSQSGEFPLYYDMLYWPLDSLRFTDITTQLVASRAVTALFYLAFTWACIGIMRCLSPPGHELRWLVPTCVVLVAPLTDIFTAVNNDAAAIAGFTLFLWGGVHALSHRMTWLHLLWLFAAMAFTIVVKQALIFSAVLLPLILLMGLWRNQQWAWHWLWLIAVTGVAVVAILALRLESAAYWTTRWPAEDQNRVENSRAVHGDHVMAALVNYESLYQRLPSKWIKSRPEHLLNFGAWVWADEPVTVPVLGFAFVATDANFMFTEILRAPEGTEESEIGTEPQFVVRQFWVPKEAEILYIFLWPYTLVQQETPNHVYYDGVVLMEGVVDLEQTPTYVDGDSRYVRWGDRESRNLARNASGETYWPNFHRQYDGRVEEIAGWSMTSVLHRILDLQWSGEILWLKQPKFMLFNLFNRLAWGGVNLPGALWGHVTLILVALGIAGCGWRARALLLHGRPPESVPNSALPYIFLCLSLALIWLGADLWIVQFMWMDNLHLSDIRYTYPSIVITVGFMVMGIRKLGQAQPKLARLMPWIQIGVFLAFNLAAMWAYLDAFAF